MKNPSLKTVRASHASGGFGCPPSVLKAMMEAAKRRQGLAEAARAATPAKPLADKNDD
jgi:hypothetical protein